MEVQRLNDDGVVVSSRRIMCSMPKDHFQNRVLGEDHVGVTVLDVFIGDTEAIMSHESWPIADCHFPSARSL